MAFFGDLVSSMTPEHIGALAGALVLYLVSVGVWRLFFSPIAHIPGPKLAALTWGYEFFYDIVRGGQYTFKIIDLHEKYGPLVRINPEEVHVGDADFHPQIYSGNNKVRERWRFFTKQFGADESALSTVSHDLHKLRRAGINPFFSTQAVRKLQPILEERANALMNRFLQHGKTRSKQPLDLVYPFSAFTYDVINEYSFSRCMYSIEDETFGKIVTDSMLDGTHYGKYVQHAGIVLKIIDALPEVISGNLVPGWRNFLKMKKDIRNQIAEIKSTENTEKWQLDVSHPTIFHEMLSSKVLPPSEKTVSRLAQDGQIIVQGGTLTSSWTLAIACFHLLHNNPAVLRRLRDELAEAIPDPNVVVPLAELENLPFLHAVVKEALRLSLGTSGRLTRVCPDENLEYTNPATGQTTIIPAGSAVSMTTYKTVTDPAIFPDPLVFHPERWLDEGAEARLDRYFTVFGGGGRVCLGMPLAQADLYTMLSKLWRVWGAPEDRRPEDVGALRLFKTTPRDAEMAHDYFIPIPWHGTKGIRVLMQAF